MSAFVRADVRLPHQGGRGVIHTPPDMSLPRIVCHLMNPHIFADPLSPPTISAWEWVGMVIPHPPNFAHPVTTPLPPPSTECRSP